MRKNNGIKEIIKQEISKGGMDTLLFDTIIETEDKEYLPLLKSNLKAIKDDENINPDWREN